MGQGYERALDMAVEENEPTSGFDGTLSEGFRTVGLKAAWNELLRNHTPLWMSLAALVRWLLSRSPARRHKKAPGDEEQYRMSLSKGRPTIFSMGLELIVATSVKMQKILAKSWSSEHFSRKEKSARRSAGSRRALDLTRPEQLRNLGKSGAEAIKYEQHSARSYEKSVLALFRNTTPE